MDNKKSVTVILPCYNEEFRVANVVKEVKKSKLVDEIIVVNDGSNEITEKILKDISGIRLISHKQRLGKSQAMKIGVLKAQSDVIVFVDSDLSGFKGSYVDDLARPIVEGELDLVLGDREKEFWLFQRIGLSVVLTGERAIKKDLLLKNIKIFEHGGFLAEVAMNKVFFKKGRVGMVFMKGVGQIFKIKKYGLTGIFDDFRFLVKVIKMVGLKELIKQAIFIKGVKKINY